mgnify:CR=1 FL=1
MDKIIVLVTQGKNSSVSNVSVKLFDDRKSATTYCEEKTSDGKYWTFAEIIDEDEVVEPCYMENL